MSKIRTRVAPSPTGYMHLGQIYQAIIDKAISIKNNGTFFLRIEDTDQKRFVEDAEEAIYEGLRNFDLEPDESPKHGGNYGPYRQSERLGIYHKHIQELLDKGHAYYCFCTKERLDQMREEQQKQGKVPMYDKKCRHLDPSEAKKRVDDGEAHVVRMKIPENQKITVNDLLRGDIEFETNTIDDQVILKADGFPTYHLAVVVDDHLMETTHVVRGPEWITSFPKHQILYEYFGWKMPVFIHTPMITNMDGSKVSKRQGHASADWYLRKGFLPETVKNFVSLLGWSHPEEKEIFSFDEFVEKFDPKDLSPISPKFDLVKLEWMNGEYLRNLEPGELYEKLMKWLDHNLTTKFRGAIEYQTHWKQEDYLNLKSFLDGLELEQRILFAKINQERVKKFEDLLPMNDFFIKEVEIDTDLLSAQKGAAEIDGHLNWVLHRLEETEWNIENLKKTENMVMERAKELNWKIGEVFYPIRIAIARSKVSPPLFESMYLLGKPKTLKLIGEAVEKL